MIIKDKFKRQRLNPDIMGLAIHHNVIDSKIVMLAHYQKDVRHE